MATLKPDVSGAPAKGISVRGRTFIMTNTSLADLIVFAYDVHRKQIIGGPDWIDEEKYDINAVPDMDGQPRLTQWKMMVQSLLAERFQFVSHHDKKELSVYVLSIAKGGPKNLIESARAGDDFSALTREVPGGFTLPMRNGLISEFTNFVLQSYVLDRPVIDRTNIEGRYDFTLTWAVLGTEFGGTVLTPEPTDDPPPNLFLALRDQLGLKLEPMKAPADVLVVDRVAKPSPN
ncbi:TIGR03435 family protein [Terriglobus sp. TAA 43]|uniref:TIGR03435 family protein n=1 Tax=Terriglobus sp. TAA 43 TaxID=278961 RepID=UPI0018DB9D26|nr:TIGR03435 family protein [Terriglobus sp. TAA 43]